MNTEKLKIKILTEQLEKLTNKTVLLEELGPEGGQFDKIDIKLLKKSYDFLLPKLSQPSQELLRAFAKGATGWNRGMIISKLALIFGYAPAAQNLGRSANTPLSRTELRSYSNNTLSGLITNGDLVEVSKGNLQPAGMQQEEQDDDLSAERVSMVIMSHLSDAQEVAGSKIGNTHINFVKFLVMKFSDMKTLINADNEFREFRKKHPGK